MKCPICGNDEFLETSEDFLESVVDKVRLHHYACSKCGYTFLVDGKIKEINAEIASYSKLEKELANVEKKLNELDHKFGIDKLREKVASLTEERKSLDITIRRQQEIDAEIKKIKSTPVAGYNETRSRLISRKNTLESEIKHFSGHKACYYKKANI